MMAALRRGKVKSDGNGKGRKRDNDGNIIEHRREANLGKTFSIGLSTRGIC